MLTKCLASIGFLWSLVEVAAGHPFDGIITAVLSFELLTWRKGLKMPNEDNHKHNALTDEILKFLDQEPSNRYEVALRLTRWAEEREREAERRVHQAYIAQAEKVASVHEMSLEECKVTLE